MNIVLINPYGPLPNEGWRKYRNILLGETLAKENHNVVWYTSKFSHHFKKNRVNRYNTGIENFKVELINSKKYQKNISLNRLLFEITFCINLYLKLRKQNNIGLIIAADPSQFVGYLARVMAKKHKAKLILDLMDEWPELFEKALPKNKKNLIKPIVLYFKFLRKRNYQKADGIIALGKNYLNIAKSISREGIPSELIYNGVDVDKMEEWSKDSSFDIKDVIINLKNNNIKCVYAGSLGMQGDNYDIKAIVKAAIFFKEKNVDFYIAGSGEGEVYILNEVKKNNLNNVFFLGNLSPEKLARLYFFCDIGLAVYGKGSNVDMPDKFYDYSSCGLAVISSLTGELRETIKNNNLGFYYEANNYLELNYKINLLVNDKELLKTIKNNSKNIGKEFSIDIQFQKFIYLLEKL